MTGQHGGRYDPQPVTRSSEWVSEWCGQFTILFTVLFVSCSPSRSFQFSTTYVKLSTDWTEHRAAIQYRRRSSVNFRRGTTFLHEKYVWNIIKMPEFYMILARKIIKISEFLWYSPEKLTKFPNFTSLFPKDARVLDNKLPEKYFSRFFFWGGGRAPCPCLLRLCFNWLNWTPAATVTQLTRQAADRSRRNVSTHSRIRATAC